MKLICSYSPLLQVPVNHLMLKENINQDQPSLCTDFYQVVTIFIHSRHTLFTLLIQHFLSAIFKIVSPIAGILSFSLFYKTHTKIFSKVHNIHHVNYSLCLQEQHMYWQLRLICSFSWIIGPIFICAHLHFHNLWIQKSIPYSVSHNWILTEAHLVTPFHTFQFFIEFLLCTYCINAHISDFPKQLNLNIFIYILFTLTAGIYICFIWFS